MRLSLLSHVLAGHTLQQSSLDSWLLATYMHACQTQQSSRGNKHLLAAWDCKTMGHAEQ